MERHDKRLTEHFCLDEFTYSGIAVDNAINNQPPPCACLALQNLAVGLLEPLRLLYGAPIAILSGYRNEKVNRLAGGVVTSQHLLHHCPTWSHMYCCPHRYRDRLSFSGRERNPQLVSSHSGNVVRGYA